MGKQFLTNLTSPCILFSLFLQACFKFRYSVGAIGGKPNHAYYFIGFYGKYMVLEGHFKFFILWTDNSQGHLHVASIRTGLPDQPDRKHNCLFSTERAASA